VEKVICAVHIMGYDRVVKEVVHFKQLKNLPLTYVGSNLAKVFELFLVRKLTN
jgi:hypothetical protein